MEQLEKQARCCSEESDEGLGHSGSDGESNRTGSPTLNGTKIENPESMVEVDADGKRKEDLYKCRFCDRTFCYLCHLKVKFRTFFRSFFSIFFFKNSKSNSTIRKLHISSSSTIYDIMKF